jgi:MinD-like ATPase involved in chromosome partitioning or flagellar assembly
MADSEKEGREIFEKLDALTARFLRRNVSLLGIVPFDKNVSRYIRAQKNICAENKNTPVAVAMHNAARQLCGLQAAKKDGFFARLFSSQLQKG